MEKENPVWIIESLQGWRVVWSENLDDFSERHTIEDGLSWYDALKLSRSLDPSKALHDFNDVS